MNDYLETRALYHHGIKGQKKGHRRFQNEDGTLTPEGKERYSKYSKIVNEKNVKKITNGIKDVMQQLNQLPIKKGSTHRGAYPELSDAELQKRVNRLNLEQRYSDLIGDTKYVKSGSEKTMEIIQTIGSIVGIVGGLTATVMSIRSGIKGNKKGN